MGRIESLGHWEGTTQSMDCPDLKFPKVLKKFPEKKWKFRVRKPSFSGEAFGRNVGDVTSPEGNATSRGFFEALEIGKLF